MRFAAGSTHLLSMTSTRSASRQVRISHGAIGANEEWVLRALEHQAEGTDLLLAGQTPLGELLATPSASRLEAISACLLDCDDVIRLERLTARGPEWLSQTGGTLRTYVN